MDLASLMLASTDVIFSKVSEKGKYSLKVRTKNESPGLFINLFWGGGDGEPFSLYFCFQGL